MYLVTNYLEELHLLSIFQHVYRLANVSNHVFVRNMPYANIAGDAKAVVHLTSGDIKTCAVIFFKIYASGD